MSTPPIHPCPQPVQWNRIAAKVCLGLSVCALVISIMMLAGCQSPASFPDPGLLADETAGQAALVPPLDARGSNYASNFLQEGDVVSITFQYATNFNVVQKITLDGALNLETVGSVKAAGKTVTDLQTQLAHLYEPQAKGDVVTVKVIASGNSVYISGAVIRPGKISMERPMTALEAIMEAGGFDPSRAKLSQVIVVRLEAGKQKTYRLNLKHALNGADETPFYLKPFDIVHVPTKTFNF